MVTNLNYYVSLSILFRLDDAIMNKFGTKGLNKFKKEIGVNWAYNVHTLTIGRVSIFKVLCLCEWADVSFEYILTGKNRGKFKPVELTKENLIKWGAPRYLFNHAPENRRIMPSFLRDKYHKIKNDENWDLNVQELISFASFLGKSEYKLIAKEL